MNSTSISLKKGQAISLSKEDPSLDEIHIGLGWKERTTDGEEFDLDASLFLVDENERCSDGVSDFIFYGNKVHPTGCVTHHGDNQSGSAKGDAEVISAVLSKFPHNRKKAVVVVTIHDYEINKQTFGDVSGAYIRLVNKKTGKEITRYDLSEDYSTETAMILGEIYQHQGEWKARAVGKGFSGGLYAAASSYGLNVTKD